MLTLNPIDYTSFGIMRHLGLQIVFAFDHHFIEQGFVCRP